LTALAETDPLVSVTGFVDDIDRLYKTSAVFVAPILTGGGIIVKILDALAARRPVVTTSYGNEGVAARPERDLLVADDPEMFATQVIRLLTDSVLAEKVASNGRNFVRENYGLEAVIRRLEEVYKVVVERAETR
jgi:polysaccharide biosynthesis protein PslH